MNAASTPKPRCAWLAMAGGIRIGVVCACVAVAACGGRVTQQVGNADATGGAAGYAASTSFGGLAGSAGATSFGAFGNAGGGTSFGGFGPGGAIGSGGFPSSPDAGFAPASSSKAITSNSSSCSSSISRCPSGVRSRTWTRRGSA